MKNIDITQIIELILSLLSLIASAFLIPWLREKLSAEKLDKLIKYTKIAVEAAEQLYGAGTGERKKEYVVSYLRSKGYDLNYYEVTAIIESAVHQLPEWLEKNLGNINLIKNNDIDKKGGEENEEVALM